MQNLRRYGLPYVFKIMDTARSVGGRLYREEDLEMFMIQMLRGRVGAGTSGCRAVLLCTAVFGGGDEVLMVVNFGDRRDDNCVMCVFCKISNDGVL